MGEGIAVDPAKVITHLRQQHAQQLDEVAFELAQYKAATETLQAENETLRASNQELGQRLAEVNSGG